MSAYTNLSAGTSTGLPHTWAAVLTPYFPSAPLELIEQVLVEVLHDYFLRSSRWVEKTPPVVLTSSQRRYVLPPPEPNTAIIYVFHGVAERSPGLPWVFVSRPMTAAENFYLGYSHGNYRYYTTPRPGVVEFDSNPPDGVNAIFTVALEPTSTSLPPDLFRMVQYDIVHGVRAAMHGQALKPWTDRAAAEAERRAFEKAIARARAYGLQGYGRAERIPRVPVAV